MSRHDLRSSNGLGPQRAWCGLRAAVAEALRSAGFSRVALEDEEEQGEDGADGITAMDHSDDVVVKKEPAEVTAVAVATDAATDNGAPQSRAAPLAPSSNAVAYVTMGPSPLEILTRETEFFLEHLFAEAKRFSESANRTQVNELDIACAYTRRGKNVRSLLEYGKFYYKSYITALADASSATGLIIKSDPNEVETYVVPIPQSVPSMLRDATTVKKRPSSMPKHMPDYPDLHTFVATPVYEPLEARYVDWRREKARLNAYAKASLAHVALCLHHGNNPKLKNFGPDLNLEPVFVKPHPRRGRYQHLLVATSVVLPDDNNETVVRSTIDFENDTEANAANLARIYTKVELREPT